MSKIAFSAPEFIARDDAVGAHARASAKAGLEGQAAKDGKDGASEFASLLKKAAEGKSGASDEASGQSQAGKTPGLQDFRAAFGRAAPSQREASNLAGDAEAEARDGVEAQTKGEAETEGEGKPQSSRDLSLAQLLSAWSETTPAAGSKPTAASAAASDQATKAGAQSRQGTGSVMPGQQDGGTQAWNALSSPDSPDAQASTTPKMAAHIVDRQTHFAPVQTPAMPGSKNGQQTNGTNGDPKLAARADASAMANAASQPGGKAEGVDPRTSDGVDQRAQGQRVPDPSGKDAGEQAGQRMREGDASSSADKASGDKGWRMSGVTASGGEMPTPGANGQAAGLPQTTLQRLGSSLAATAGELVGAQMSAAADPDAPTRGDNLVRILELELTPAELGLVRVRMRLSNNGIELQVAAARASTAQLLEQDSSKLTSILSDSGYDVDTVTVQASSDGFRSHLLPQSRQEASSMPNQNQPGGSFQNQGEANAGGGNGGRDRNPNSETSSSQSSFKDGDGSNTSKGETSRSGSLYV